MEPPGSLSCSFSLKVARSVEETFDAVYRPERLSSYFSTGGADVPLEAGTEAHWSFHDHPQYPPFPVRVLESARPNRIVLEGQSGIGDAWNQVVFEFEALSTDRTSIRVTESGWPTTAEGVSACVRNSGGWANMLTCLKAYVELGVKLREFMF